MSEADKITALCETISRLKKDKEALVEKVASSAPTSATASASASPSPSPAPSTGGAEKDGAAEIARIEQEIAVLEAKLTELQPNRVRHDEAREKTPFEYAFATVLQEHILLGELKLVGQNAVSGVYVRGNPLTSFAWDGVVFVRGGVYQGGIFKFRILIPYTYPDTAVPRVFFQSSVTHPRVNEITGEMDTSKYYKSWRPESDRLWHLLKLVRHIFYHVDDDKNSDLAALYSVDKESFGALVRGCVERAQKTVYMVSPNSIRFHAFQRDLEEAQRMMKEWESSLKRPGPVDRSATVPFTSASALPSSQPSPSPSPVPSQDETTTSSTATTTSTPAAAPPSSGAPAAAAVTPRTPSRVSEAMHRAAALNASIVLSPHPVPAPERSLRVYLKSILGNITSTIDVKQGDASISGYMSLMNEAREYERRYLFLDSNAGVMNIYETEKMHSVLKSMPVAEVCRVFEPEDPESRANNALVIVAPSVAWQMRAPSSHAQHIWIRAINHTLTLLQHQQ